MKEGTKSYLKRFANLMIAVTLTLIFVILLLIGSTFVGFLPPAVMLPLITFVAMAIAAYVPDLF